MYYIGNYFHQSPRVSTSSNNRKMKKLRRLAVHYKVEINGTRNAISFPSSVCWNRNTSHWLSALPCHNRVLPILYLRLQCGWGKIDWNGWPFRQMIKHWNGWPADEPFIHLFCYQAFTLPTSLSTDWLTCNYRWREASFDSAACSTATTRF